MNKETRKNYNKLYYEKNNTILKDKMKEKVECNLCGTLSSKSNLYYHKKTNKCKHLQERKQERKQEVKQEMIKTELKTILKNASSEISTLEFLNLLLNGKIPENI